MRSFAGVMAVFLTPNLAVATVLSSSFYAIFNVFAGFAINPPSIPGWWIWVSFTLLAPLPSPSVAVWPDPDAFAGIHGQAHAVCLGSHASGIHSERPA